MTTSLGTIIGKHIEDYMKIFIDEIVAEHPDLSADALHELWLKTSGNPSPTASVVPRCSVEEADPLTQEPVAIPKTQKKTEETVGCPYIFKKGQNKGTACSKNAKGSGKYCSKHGKWEGSEQTPRKTAVPSRKSTVAAPSKKKASSDEDLVLRQLRTKKYHYYDKDTGMVFNKEKEVVGKLDQHSTRGKNEWILDSILSLDDNGREVCEARSFQVAGEEATAVQKCNDQAESTRTSVLKALGLDSRGAGKNSDDDSETVLSDTEDILKEIQERQDDESLNAEEIYGSEQDLSEEDHLSEEDD